MPDGPVKHGVPHDEDELAHWTRVNNIVGLRTRGMTNTEIAALLGVGETWVEEAVKWAADNTRAAVEDRCRVKFELHDRRLENLYRVLDDQMQKMILNGTFRPEVVKTMIMLLDRQSKMWDIDRKKRGTEGAAGSGGMNDEWLNNASYNELAAKVREYGYDVPDPFSLEASPPVASGVR